MECYNKWHDIKDKLPSKSTRYSSKYGVAVIGLDINAHRQHPSECNFNFEKNRFETLHYGNSGVDFIGIEITHWTPMPRIKRTNERAN